MRFHSLLFAAALLSTSFAAQADVITANIGGYIGGFDTTLGTFTYVIPAGETISSATVTLNHFVPAYSGRANVYLDGTLVTTLTTAVFAPITGTYEVSNLTDLTDGSAVLSYTVATLSTGAPGLVGTGGETLTINTAGSPLAATPEPSSIALLGTGVLGAAGVLRRRFA